MICDSMPSVLERSRCRWEDNIRMYGYIKEMGINTRNSVDSPQHRDYWRALVKIVLNRQMSLVTGDQMRGNF